MTTATNTRWCDTCWCCGGTHFLNYRATFIEGGPFVCDVCRNQNVPDHKRKKRVTQPHPSHAKLRRRYLSGKEPVPYTITTNLKPKATP